MSGIQEMLGLTLSAVEVDHVRDEITFATQCGRTFRMDHCQDCCESVVINDIEGDLNDLTGSPLVVSEEVSSDGEPPQDGCDDSWTWTFYRLATVKGFVVIRWFGTSNGYYSESVDFNEIGRLAPSA